MVEVSLSIFEFIVPTLTAPGLSLFPNEFRKTTGMQLVVLRKEVESFCHYFNN